MSFHATCALFKDGTGSCWGSGTTAPKLVSNLANVVQLSAGKNRFCAALQDGTAKMLGLQLGGYRAAELAERAASDGG